MKRICLESQIHISILYASWRFRFQSISLIWSARSNQLSCLCIPCPVPLIWLMGEIHQFLDFNMLYPGSSLYSMDHFLPGVKVICLIYMAFIWGYIELAKTGVYSLSLTNKLATRLGRKPYGKPLERATLDVGTTLSWGLWLYSFRACLAIPGGKVGGAIMCSAI